MKNKDYQLFNQCPNRTKCLQHHQQLVELFKIPPQRQSQLKLYRKRVKDYYKNKITKPFLLYDQPEYHQQKQLRKKIQLGYKLQKIQQKKQINNSQKSQYNPESQIKLILQKQYLQKGQKTAIINSNLPNIDSYTVHLNSSNKIKTEETKPSFDKQQRRRNKRNQTIQCKPKQQLINNIRCSDQQQNFYAINPTEPISYNNRNDECKNYTNIVNHHRSHNGHSKNTFLFSKSSLPKKRQTIVKKANTLIDKNHLLKVLNTLTSYEQKSKNKFILPRKKLHQILIDRYSNEILTQYFQLKNNEEFVKIYEMFEYLIQCNVHQKLMICFLTYDFNRDGWICPKDLYHFNEKLSLQSSILSDVHRITKFMMKNAINDTQCGLPRQFIHQSTRNMYHIIQQNLNSLHNTRQIKQFTYSSSNSIRKSHKSPRKIRQQFQNLSGICRIFGLYDNTMKEKSHHKKIFNFPGIKQNSAIRYKINFSTFCNIFMNQQPIFIYDVVEFLSGNKTKHESQLNIMEKQQNKNKNRIKTQDLTQSSKNKNIYHAFKILAMLKSQQNQLNQVHYTR